MNALQGAMEWQTGTADTGASIERMPAPAFPAVDETIYVEVLAAAITSPTTATVQVLVKGFFTRPGNRVDIAPVMIHATIPAVVLPR